MLQEGSPALLSDFALLTGAFFQHSPQTTAVLENPLLMPSDVELSTAPPNALARAALQPYFERHPKALLNPKILKKCQVTRVDNNIWIAAFPTEDTTWLTFIVQGDRAVPIGISTNVNDARLLGENYQESSAPPASQPVTAESSPAPATAPVATTALQQRCIAAIQQASLAPLHITEPKVRFLHAGTRNERFEIIFTAQNQGNESISAPIYRITVKNREGQPLLLTTYGETMTLAPGKSREQLISGIRGSDSPEDRAARIYEFLLMKEVVAGTYTLHIEPASFTYASTSLPPAASLLENEIEVLPDATCRYATNHLPAAPEEIDESSLQAYQEAEKTRQEKVFQTIEETAKEKAAKMLARIKVRTDPAMNTGKQKMAYTLTIENDWDEDIIPKSITIRWVENNTVIREKVLQSWVRIQPDRTSKIKVASSNEGDDVLQKKVLSGKVKLRAIITAASIGQREIDINGAGYLPQWAE